MSKRVWYINQASALDKKKYPPYDQCLQMICSVKCPISYHKRCKFMFFVSAHMTENSRLSFTILHPKNIKRLHCNHIENAIPQIKVHTKLIEINKLQLTKSNQNFSKNRPKLHKKWLNHSSRKMTETFFRKGTVVESVCN